MNPQHRFGLEDTAANSGVAPDLILHFVALAWISPVDEAHHYFDQEDVARIRLIHELQDRLGVNEESVPVIMHLIDQINRLHLEIKG